MMEFRIADTFTASLARLTGDNGRYASCQRPWNFGRIESVTDDADLEEVHNTERRLLYCGMRAPATIYR